MLKYKFCIWDVGKTIYAYSLNPLDQYCKSKTKDLDAYYAKSGVKKFNYNPFMKGDIDCKQFHKDLCDYVAMDYDVKIAVEINKAMQRGIGEFFDESVQAIKFLKENNVENCILSNALPNISGNQDVRGMFAEDKIFCSFELGLLKPDVKIFQTVVQKLNAKPEEIMFIDDKTKNVNSAKSLGIHGIIYDRKTVLNEVKVATRGVLNTINNKLGDDFSR